MTEAIGNDRSNEQCRSHHKKMLKKFKTLKKIVENFQEPQVNSKNIDQSTHFHEMHEIEDETEEYMAKLEFLEKLGESEISLLIIDTPLPSEGRNDSLFED